MSSILSLGSSALQSYQQALSVTGNNIANANVEGYTRENVQFGTEGSRQIGAGYIGTGVYTSSVERMADQFMISQIRVDSSSFNQANFYHANISQVDSLLANSSTGLTVAMQSYFAALQTSSEDPTSIPARQMVISQAEGLAQRFDSLSGYLNEQNDAANKQIATITDEINTLTRGIAELNDALNKAQATPNGDLPHNLLDDRDKLLLELSELVSVKVVEQDGRDINVFFESGQPLVVGKESTDLVAQADPGDPNKTQIFMHNGAQLININDSINGGKLGGLMEYQNDALGKSLNELGLIALGIADSVNELNKLGIDLNGQFGNDIFTDINSEAMKEGRVILNANNAAPMDRELSVEIKDISQLTTSDYSLEFIGPNDFNYRIVRESDGETVQQGSLAGVFPTRLNVDGFEIMLEGGSFQNGDQFLIQPTRTAAQNTEVIIADPMSLAFAQPIITDTNLGNLGNGAISNGKMLSVTDTQGNLLPTFSQPDNLNPPLIIKFTSPTTYDILDNSDPANPVHMDPPMKGYAFTPGVTNTVFSADMNQVSVASNTALSSAASAGNTNGSPVETLTIVTTNPDTGVPLTQTVTLAANDSARAAATKISSLQGVSARADTQASLQINDVGAAAMGVSLNGIALTDANAPNPLTPEYLRDQINGNASLEVLGITAVTDGNELVVRSVRGDDLSFSVTGGDAGDSLQLTQVNSQAATGTTAVTQGNTVTVGGVIMVDMADNGRLSTSIAAPGGRFSNPAELPSSSYFGFQVDLSGVTQAGDEFSINFNVDGASDNRNAAAMAGLQSDKILSGGDLSFNESYSQLIEFVGAKTSQARVNEEATKTLLEQSTAQRDALSGVNLDEEASKLIQFQQAYQAAAQLITASRDTFSSLLQAVG